MDRLAVPFRSSNHGCPDLVRMERGKMLILSNVLVLAMIVADEPKPPETLTFPSAMPKITRPHGGNPEPDVIWNLTLPEAIRIGLENSEVVRVISLGGSGKAPVGGFEPTPTSNAVGVLPPGPGIVIARLNADASVWNFKAAIMAHVRSIEQQYWALAHCNVVLWSRETAVRLGEEILKRERAGLEVGRATQADVAEVEQQLENFKLNLVTATSDVITTERQLRNILGLPASDNRRIVPSTAATEAKVDPVWEESVAAMNASQPDLAIQRQLVGAAEFKAMLESDNPTLSPKQREVSLLLLEKQQAFLRQVLHQTTHSLARFFLQVGTNYDQYQTAQKLRSAAQQRLEAQRAFYEEGRIAIDRLLDAVSQYANAIAQESEYKFTYNTALAALEEAKGTLLAHDQITVAEGPSPRKAYLQAKDGQVAPAAFEPPAKPATAPAANAQAAPMMYKLKAKLGGVKFLEIEVEVNPASPSR